jgi:hypothetical protein
MKQESFNSHLIELNIAERSYIILNAKYFYDICLLRID